MCVARHVAGRRRQGRPSEKVAKQRGQLLARGNRPGTNLLRRAAELGGQSSTLSPDGARPLPQCRDLRTLGTTCTLGDDLPIVERTYIDLQRIVASLFSSLFDVRDS